MISNLIATYRRYLRNLLTVIVIEGYFHSSFELPKGLVD